MNHVEYMVGLGLLVGGLVMCFKECGMGYRGWRLKSEVRCDVV
jgi:hypothetical protein